MSGWIKLHRSLKEWEWYHDPNTLRMLVHLLVSVNYEKKKWKGMVVNSGELITSYENLGNELGLSRQQVRTSLDKLESSQEITRKRTRHCLHISLVKWGKLQSGEEENNPTTTRQQPDNNPTITLTKEYKEIKENNNIGDVVEKDFGINESHSLKIVNYQNEHQTWIETLYRNFKLANKKLGVALKDFNDSLIKYDTVHTNISEYKRHFVNWMHAQESKGNLTHLKK